ncbi:MAG: toxin TcdB middle/N-terminal domain-containing protein, partial [Spirochaetota bacterium]
GAPLVTIDGALKTVAISGSSYTLKDAGETSLTLMRADLADEVYPYTWIQGDYNGDGKTDVGIFHLKDSAWYFALTGGTVPDMISEVKNGIGGSYEMTYENSSRFDNTDNDGIPRLPMNYKVCTEVNVDDGFGNSVRTKYAYSKGYAFSAFIHGKKETDYFGFSRFTVTDAAGIKTVNTYNTVPYDDFRKNRALAGAIKQSRVVGSDSVEYSRSEYEYTLHEIRENTSQSPSFLIEPTSVRKYAKRTLAETREAKIVLGDGYDLESRTESVTDHFPSTGSGQAEKVTTYSEFWNNSATNEMRLSVKKDFAGSACEIRSDYNYDSRGNLTAETTRYSGTGLAAASDRVTRYGYDRYGNRIRTERSGSGTSRIVTQEYDNVLNQYVVKETAYGPVELNTTYEINYKTAFGAAHKKTDPNGGSVYYDYDDYGRLAKQRIDTDSGTETLAQYVYQPASDGWSRTPASGKVIQYTGDGE